MFTIRTTSDYPQYLKANFLYAEDAQWTPRDTRTKTWEDDAETFNEVEANCIIDELSEAGISAELC